MMSDSHYFPLRGNGDRHLRKPPEGGGGGASLMASRARALPARAVAARDTAAKLKNPLRDCASSLWARTLTGPHCTAAAIPLPLLTTLVPAKLLPSFAPWDRPAMHATALAIAAATITPVTSRRRRHGSAMEPRNRSPQRRRKA